MQGRVPLPRQEQSGELKRGFGRGGLLSRDAASCHRVTIRQRVTSASQIALFHSIPFNSIPFHFPGVAPLQSPHPLVRVPFMCPQGLEYLDGCGAALLAMALKPGWRFPIRRTLVALEPSIWNPVPSVWNPAFGTQHRCEAMAVAPVFLRPSHDVHAGKDVDDVVDAPPLDAQLECHGVQRDGLLHTDKWPQLRRARSRRSALAVLMERLAAGATALRGEPGSWSNGMMSGVCGTKSENKAMSFRVWGFITCCLPRMHEGDSFLGSPKVCHRNCACRQERNASSKNASTDIKKMKFNAWQNP
jgi:hypothetical protein